ARGADGGARWHPTAPTRALPGGPLPPTEAPAALASGAVARASPVLRPAGPSLRGGPAAVGGTLDPLAAPRRGDPPRTGRPGARAAGGGGGRASRAGAHHPPGRGGRTGLGRGSAGAGGGSARGGCPRAGSPPGPGDAHWTGAAAAATGRDRVGTGGVPGPGDAAGDAPGGMVNRAPRRHRLADRRRAVGGSGDLRGPRSAGADPGAVGAGAPHGGAIPLLRG